MTGTPIPCRSFWMKKGYCGIHPDKPGGMLALPTFASGLRLTVEEEQ